MVNRSRPRTTDGAQRGVLCVLWGDEAVDVPDELYSEANRLGILGLADGDVVEQEALSASDLGRAPLLVRETHRHLRREHHQWSTAHTRRGKSELRPECTRQAADAYSGAGVITAGMSPTCPEGS